MVQLVRDLIILLSDTPPAYLFSNAAMLSPLCGQVLSIWCSHDMAEIKEIKKGMAPFQSTEKA